jgi:hypothetical protein
MAVKWYIQQGRGARPGRGAYYVGKALWAKGYSELVALLGPDPGWAEAARLAREEAAPGSLAEDWGPADEGVEDLPKVGVGGEEGETLPPSVDAFGSGEDADAVRAAAAAGRVPLTLRPGRDHLDPALRSYRVFVNPSTSDVVATTSAEALALGRWLVCPIHPCNEFFSTFRACLRYGDAAGFRAQLCRALSRPPPRLSTPPRSKRSRTRGRRRSASGTRCSKSTRAARRYSKPRRRESRPSRLLMRSCVLRRKWRRVGAMRSGASSRQLIWRPSTALRSSCARLRMSSSR